MRLSTGFALLGALASLATTADALPKVERLRNAKAYKAKELVAATKLQTSSAEAVLNASQVVTSGGSRAMNPDYKPTTSAPKKNVWASLTNDEAASVISFLHNQTSLNLTASDDAGAWDNAITIVDLLTPNKTEVTSYLRGEGAEPKRYARATIAFGATEEPYTEDFGIGPLPISDETKLMDISWLSTKGSTKIPNTFADEDAQGDFFIEVAAGLQDITQDLINGTVTNATVADFDIWGVEPVWFSEGRVIQWVGFWRHVPDEIFQFDATTLLPSGLYFKVDTTGRDPSKWEVKGWLYNDQFFNSTKAFRGAWESGTLKKADQLNSPYGSDELPWYGTDSTGADSPWEDDERLPPVMIAPEGQRFKVDDDERFVEWQDYSFYVTFTRDTGIRIYDLKYQGKTIMYELGLDEAVAHYSGNDPVQSGTAYLDTYYGFGPYAFELVDGYDCPAYSHYWNATFHASEQSTTHRNAICLYEQDTMLPMQRHSSGKYVSSTKDIALVLRSVSTVGNYDYTFTYTFHSDGTIETKVSASGYIQSAFYAANDDYGYQIHKGLSGSMHDHVLNFKADVDILGTKNSLAKHAVVPVQVEYPWSDGQKRHEMRLERSYIEKETALNWGGATHAMMMVVNKDEVNEFGEPMGYRFMPGVGNGHSLTIKESPNLYDAANFATSHYYVARQKDTEKRSAHSMNTLYPQDPIINFQDYFDGESVEQEDLVLWFNLGMTHVPHTGDLPNTVQTTAQGSMLFFPHNYLKSDPSRRSVQQLRIDYTTEGHADSIHGFNKNRPSSDAAYNVSNAFPSLWDYAGDENTRKFPYDPLHPFNDTESIA